MTHHRVIPVGRNTVSQCIRTLEYLIRKHRTMLESPEEGVTVAPKKVGGRGRGIGKRGPALTPADHDEIFVAAHRPKVSGEMLARKYGRSLTVIYKVKNRRHPLYDPVRSEAALAAARVVA